MSKIREPFWNTPSITHHPSTVRHNNKKTLITNEEFELKFPKFRTSNRIFLGPAIGFTQQAIVLDFSGESPK